jgi:anti-sigma factor RsiW
MSDDRPIGEDDLQAFVDDRLSPERRAAVEGYLGTNPPAAAQVSAYQDVREALRARLAFKAHEPLPSRLRIANIAAARRQRAQRRLAPVAASLVWLMVGGVAGWATHAWLGAAGWPAILAGRTALADDAFAAHRTFVAEVAHPVEVGAAQEQHLVQWLSRRLGRPLRAPDLNEHGLRLMGGRLLPGDDGPAAQFMYENLRGTRVTLYLQGGPREESAFRFARHGDVSAFYWVEDGFGYVVSGALDRERLLAVAETAYRQFHGGGTDRKRTVL